MVSKLLKNVSRSSCGVQTCSKLFRAAPVEFRPARNCFAQLLWSSHLLKTVSRSSCGVQTYSKTVSRSSCGVHKLLKTVSRSSCGVYKLLKSVSRSSCGVDVFLLIACVVYFFAKMTLPKRKAGTNGNSGVQSLKWIQKMGKQGKLARDNCRIAIPDEDQKMARKQTNKGKLQDCNP